MVEIRFRSIEDQVRVDMGSDSRSLVADWLRADGNSDRTFLGAD